MKWQWIVSFNDGQRVSSKTLLEEIPTRNPWTEVLNYFKKNPTLISGKKREITHIELIINNQRYNSPSASPNAVFHSDKNGFSNFWVFYKNLSSLGDPQNDDNLVGISFRVGDFRVINWVNEVTNVSVTQILNVVNPITKKEKEFSGIENTITAKYNDIYNS